ncbi:MAG: hypothetical protein Q7J98_01625 [Kiritimatiellia bacterium]|nr:hypothetical protein [Kiritimatiellia bacterium]
MTTEERLDIVEQELKETKAGLTAAKRRNHWMLGGVAILVLGCLTMAATPGDNRIIRANQFFLEDANGKPRVMMSVEEDGPRLSMMGANGKTRASMYLLDDEPWLAMYDANGRTRAIMSVTEDGPGLDMFGATRKTRASMWVNKEVGPGMIMDKNGKPIWKAP